MDEYIIDQQVENVTAEIEEKMAARKYSEALSVLKSSWSFFRNQLNRKRGILVGELLVRNGYFAEATGLLEHLVLLHPRDPSALRCGFKRTQKHWTSMKLFLEQKSCRNPNVAISTLNICVMLSLRTANLKGRRKYSQETESDCKYVVID